MNWNMIINKFNLKYGHLCQTRNRKQKFKSLQTKYVISASATLVYGRSAYNDIQRITNCDVKIKYEGGNVIDYNIFNDNKKYYIIYMDKVYIYLDHILSVHILYSHKHAGGRAGVTMQHVNINNLVDSCLLKIEQ